MTMAIMGGQAYYGNPAPYYAPRGPYYGRGHYYRRLVNATAKIATVKDESTGRFGRWIFLWLWDRPLTRLPRLWIKFEG